jgi:hypothetical protein
MTALRPHRATDGAMPGPGRPLPDYLERVGKAAAFRTRLAAVITN